jgi:hypothetical protein
MRVNPVDALEQAWVVANGAVSLEVFLAGVANEILRTCGKVAVTVGLGSAASAANDALVCMWNDLHSWSLVELVKQT